MAIKKREDSSKIEKTSLSIVDKRDQTIRSFIGYEERKKYLTVADLIRD